MVDHQAAVAEMWARLEKAPSQRADPFRTPTVATVDGHGLPEARVVVLRAASAAGRTVRIHTDAASAKYAALQRTPHLAFCFWDSKRRVQLRLDGDVVVEEGTLVEDALTRLSASERRQYGISPPPGTPIEASTDYDHDDAPRFVRIVCTVQRMDVLWLARPRHRRLRANWDGQAWQSTWVVP